MARAGWEDHGDGIWFAAYENRRGSWSLLIEETPDGFVESACLRSSDDYEVLGTSSSLKEAQRHIISAIRSMQ